MATLDESSKHKHGVTFDFDKYNRPKLLDLKDSIASDIVNAIIMKPGNLPSRPLVGVDFFDTISYEEENDTLGEQIQQRISDSCGTLPGGAYIQATDVSLQETTAGDIVALLIIKLSIPEEETSLLGIAISKNADKVKFNFDYVTT